MEKNEVDEIIRIQAAEAVRLQKVIQESIPFQIFADSQLPWLKENVFEPMTKEIILMVKGLDFVPNSIAQVAHIKGQLENMDRIENRILGRVQEARDARAKLDEIENSTPQEG
jgi:hypothetical protein